MSNIDSELVSLDHITTHVQLLFPSKLLHDSLMLVVGQDNLFFLGQQYIYDIYICMPCRMIDNFSPFAYTFCPQNCKSNYFLILIYTDIYIFIYLFEWPWVYLPPICPELRGPIHMALRKTNNTIS